MKRNPKVVFSLVGCSINNPTSDEVGMKMKRIKRFVVIAAYPCRTVA